MLAWEGQRRLWRHSDRTCGGQMPWAGTGCREAGGECQPLGVSSLCPTLSPSSTDAPSRSSWASGPLHPCATRWQHSPGGELPGALEHGAHLGNHPWQFPGAIIPRLGKADWWLLLCRHPQAWPWTLWHLGKGLRVQGRAPAVGAPYGGGW